MNKLPVKWRAEKVLALELMVMNPSMTKVDIANEVGVTRDTIYKWFKDPEFVEIFYEKYMVSFGAKLPSVLQSMIREAEAGSVQAGRLVLEHSGKLIKRVEVQKHQSPFEKFLNGAEVEAEFEVLPKRPEVVEAPHVPTKKEIKAEERKKKTAVMKRKEAYQWRARAKAVGVKPLSSGRKTKLQQLEWQQKVRDAEEAMFNFSVGGKK